MKGEAETQLLMIDDDENDAMLVRHMIGKMPDSGCQFHWAGSYDQGLRKLSEINWDLCLVDYQLGAHTGVQVVTESRVRGVKTPFLLLTGSGNRAIDLQAMKAGVKGYLEKSRLCPLELERAIRYAIGGDQTRQQAPIPTHTHVPADVVELLRAAFHSRQPFVVIALMLDSEAVVRNRLTSRQVDNINAGLDSLIRGRISDDEAIVRTPDGAHLLVSFLQETLQARQFLSVLLSDPLNVASDDRTRTVSLPAILRRNVFASSSYLGPVPLLDDLDAFLNPGPRSHGKDFHKF